MSTYLMSDIHGDIVALLLSVFEALLNRRGRLKVLLYGLRNQIKKADIDEWLFGEIIDD